MLFTNTTQIIVLALVLVVGWLFGLASHPGGRKWKRLYHEERTVHLHNRELAEAQAREDAKRIAALEKVNATVATAQAAPVVVPASAPRVVRTTGAKSWFGWGGDDDLTRIRGVDAARAAGLKEQGIGSYRALATLGHVTEATLEERLGVPAGTMQREQWRYQAALLADRKTDEHAERFA